MKLPEVKKTTIYGGMIVAGAAVVGAGTVLYCKEKKSEKAEAEDDIPTIEPTIKDDTAVDAE